jgi:negative regulator of replication initiation
MRTTIELDESLHERMRRQAQREGISLARLLGRLVEHGADAPRKATVPTRKSDRFTVIAAAAPDARTTVSAVQKMIDEEGIL